MKFQKLETYENGKNAKIVIRENSKITNIVKSQIFKIVKIIKLLILQDCRNCKITKFMKLQKIET